LAVKADVAAIDAAHRDEQAVLGLDVWGIGAGSERRGIIEVIIENGGDASGKFRVV
jgi:hypothetical protein